MGRARRGADARAGHRGAPACPDPAGSLPLRSRPDRGRVAQRANPARARAAAPAGATALRKLLAVTHGAKSCASRGLHVRHEGFLKWIAGFVIPPVAAGVQNAGDSLEVTLLAHAVALVRRELRRIHDRARYGLQQMLA